MTNQELHLYNMSDEELGQWKKVQKKILEYCKLIEIPDEMYELVQHEIADCEAWEHVAGFCKSEGYYYIDDGDRGELFLNKFDNEDDVCFFLMMRITWKIGGKIEMANRKEDEKKWKYYEDRSKTIPGHICWVENKEYIYHTNHDTRKPLFEYTIDAMSKVFGVEKTQPLLIEYTNAMNRWFHDEHWIYDCSKRAFIENSYSEEFD